MRALEWDGRKARVVDKPRPRPEEGEALVRVALAGVCRTDLEIVRGYMGFRGVLGHEFVGVVEDGPREWRGRRVVGEINFSCGTCERCAAGLRRHCPRRRVMGIQNADGAFAEYVALPCANLHAVPDEVEDAQAVFVEPLAAAFEIFEQVDVPRGERTVVLGDGKLGLLIAQVLDSAGADVVLVGRHDRKLDVLRSRGIRAVLLDAWDRAPAPLVVEATGRAGGLALAIEAVEPRGRLVLKSTIAGPVDADVTRIVVDELQLIGSRCGPFPPALSLLANGEVEVRALIERRLPLRRADEALEEAGRPGALKVLIDCSGS